MQTHWTLPSNLLPTSIQIMAPHGARGNEGLALWLGTEKDSSITVTHVIELRGAGFKTSPLNLQISMRGMSALTDLADRYNVFLVGQIHSHPGTFVDLSQVDKVHGIRVPDYLSMVCPHYAQVAATPMNQCGIHVFEDGSYRRMSAYENAQRISATAAEVIKLVLEIPS